MYKVGVTGGIGSGKSTLCRLFGELGIPLYDSDKRAKWLMSNSEELQRSIIECFGEQSYVAGELNRPYLAQVVFNDKGQLDKLNSIVHPAVRIDFTQWSERQDAPYVILESALLFSSDFYKSVDTTVCVLSPEQMRIERVISRDALTHEQVEERIKNQLSDDQMSSLADHSVVNFDLEDLEDAAKVLNKRFLYEADQK